MIYTYLVLLIIALWFSPWLFLFLTAGAGVVSLAPMITEKALGRYKEIFNRHPRWLAVLFIVLAAVKSSLVIALCTAAVGALLYCGRSPVRFWFGIVTFVAGFVVIDLGARWVASQRGNAVKWIFLVGSPLVGLAASLVFAFLDPPPEIGWADTWIDRFRRWFGYPSTLATLIENIYAALWALQNGFAWAIVQFLSALFGDIGEQVGRIVGLTLSFNILYGYIPGIHVLFGHWCGKLASQQSGSDPLSDTS